MGEFDAFKQFEVDGWSEAGRADRYSRMFGRITGAAVPETVAALDLRPGDRVLDLCCGHGPITAALLDAGADVTAGDVSPAMLELLRRDYPKVRAEICDAEKLQFADAEFDAVISGFGFCHLARPEAALAEARRVLKPGGRLAITVWCGPEVSPTFALLMAAIRDHGDPDVKLPAGPDFHLFADAAGTERLFQAAGFADVRTDRLDLRWELASPDDLHDIWAESTLRVAELLAAQSETARADIRAAMRDAMIRDHGGKDGPWAIAQPAALSVGTAG